MGTRVADATMTQLWRTTLEVLDSDGIPVQQRAFLSLAKLVGLLDDTALIAVPNDFTKDIVETRLRDRVTATLGSQLGRDVRLAVTVDPSLAEAPVLDLEDEGHDLRAADRRRQIDDLDIGEDDQGRQRPRRPPGRERPPSAPSHGGGGYRRPGEPDRRRRRTAPGWSAGRRWPARG